MKAITCYVVLVALVAFVCATAVGQEKVYDEGTVWSVGMIKTEANMQEEYITDLSKAWQKIMEAAKAEGLIVSYQIFIGEAANPDDWDVMLLTEFENYAALDGLYDKFDALVANTLGGEEEQMKANIERGKIRDVFGGKLMQEIHIK